MAWRNAVLIMFLISIPAVASTSPSDVAYNAYSTTNATTSSYTTLISATLRPFSEFYICDTSAHFIKLAVGASGSEIDLTGCPVSACSLIHLGKIIPSGSRISFRALDATASTGGLMVTGSQ